MWPPTPFPVPVAAAAAAALATDPRSWLAVVMLLVVVALLVDRGFFLFLFGWLLLPLLLLLLLLLPLLLLALPVGATCARSVWRRGPERWGWKNEEPAALLPWTNTPLASRGATARAVRRRKRAVRPEGGKGSRASLRVGAVWVDVGGAD